MATIESLLESYDPRLRAAFLAAVDEITSNVTISQITRALERGDIQGAVDALYIDRAAFAEFETVIESAYGEGGAITVDNLGQLVDENGNRFVFRFNVRNPQAEQWLREYSATLVTNTVAEQRAIIRQELEAGMAAGRNPRSVALDITGRYNRVTKKREGGIVGLSGPQQRAVINARRELESGDYSAFMQRARRDKRFDRTLMKAIREGKPLTQAQITRILSRYKDGLLKLRGETIGRTEALRALNASQYEAIRQLVASGRIRADQVRLSWKATHDPRTRFTHAVLDGETVNYGESFQSPSGARLRYPGDPQAPASETINCRCTLRPRIEFLRNVR